MTEEDLFERVFEAFTEVFESGCGFDDLAELSFDIDDWDETGGEWVFENTMNKIDAEMFADVDKVEQGGNAVLCTMGDVRDVAQYLMSDAHSGVAYYIPSWLPSSADVNPVEETMSYMISFVPTAEFES